MLSFLRRYRALFALAAIIVASASMSVYRVYTVPILQCPDEDSHIDYAFSIYSAGTLLPAATPPSSGWNTKFQAVDYDWERISHLYTLHLSSFVNMHPIRVSEAKKVSPDYGSSAYFERLDQTAPKAPIQTTELTPKDNPWLITGHPFGYYALLALVIKMATLATSSLTDLFFAARFFSVGLLIGSLLLFYRVLRELRLQPGAAVGVTATFALHPLTYNVAACVQPDNLSLFLVLLSSYLGLVATRKPGPYILAGLAAVLGVLLVTKYQFFVFTFLPVIAMLAVRRRLTLVSATMMLLPSTALFGIHLWVTWGALRVLGEHVKRSANWFDGALGAIENFWFGGGAFISYWSTTYGWASLPAPVRFVLLVGTPFCLIATVLYLLKTGARTIRVARFRPWLAARLVTANPLVSSYVLFVGFMIALYAHTDNGFYAQGRHFLPFIPAGLLLVTIYVPRLLPVQRWRERASGVLIAALMVYCSIGAVHSVVTLKARYYPVGFEIVSEAGLLHLQGNTSGIVSRYPG